MMRRLFTLGLGLLLVACATTGPDVQTRQTLAPSGTLRVGVYLGSPTSMVLDAQGQKVGVSIGLGRKLARQLGVPAQIIEYKRVAEVVDALTRGEVDFTFTNASADRAKLVQFTEPLVDLELGYLVGPTSPIKSLAEVDKLGRRIGVSQGSTSQGTLGRMYRSAKVVPVASLQVASEQLKQQQLDAFATNKAILNEMADGLPGFRILEGRWGLEHLAIAVPKGREQAAPYLQDFARQAQTSGLLKTLSAQAGLRGTVDVQK
jgi:polar amino acid transport system substrate-binding protein